ncbi:MAG: hypothetical protein R3B06_26525 [Kofleriaceae bacterium]
MKRLSVIALLATAVLFTACKKENKDSKPATTEAAKPAAGTAAAPAAPAPTAPAAAAPADPTGAPAPTAAAPADADFEANMNKAVAMFEAMGKAAEAAGEDCGKAAEGLGKVMDDNKDFMEQAKKWDADPAFKAKSEEWMKGHMDQLMAPMMKVGTLGQKCATDAKFAEVMKRFDSMGK